MTDEVYEHLSECLELCFTEKFSTEPDPNWQEVWRMFLKDSGFTDAEFQQELNRRLEIKFKTNHEQ